MKHKENLSTVITILVAAFLVAGLAWIKTDQYFNYKNKELKIRAVEGCMTATTYQFQDKDKGITTVEPKKDVYDKCMKDKGY